MMHVPEKNRMNLPGHPMSSTSKDGNNGVFIIEWQSREFYIIASDGEGWEHVSVTTNGRCPNWNEMCFIKNLFWDETDCVVQYHPPKSEYVNNHPTCLHLWRPITEKIPVPPSILIGVKTIQA